MQFTRQINIQIDLFSLPLFSDQTELRYGGILNSNLILFYSSGKYNKQFKFKSSLQSWPLREFVGKQIRQMGIFTLKAKSEPHEEQPWKDPEDKSLLKASKLGMKAYSRKHCLCKVSQHQWDNWQMDGYIL